MGFLWVSGFGLVLRMIPGVARWELLKVSFLVGVPGLGVWFVVQLSSGTLWNWWDREYH